ncbi:hypothetical protein [Planomicrobium sp. CPCC 101110]|uniref:hypothetical protein n=1 Tax=Planomicrobium sp. CPCC 101110 TaxID=2599619 RepID=UPI0011B4D293|nr:hypothetical protein [Planomicrobium sp. CPCC 101110]TWT28253.1 hypothetical protein FQV30_07065 [Planomicrobium sp. CPCC 101110]
MNRKLFGYALAAALSLGTVGGTLAYAADSEETSMAEEASTVKGMRGLDNIDEAAKSKIEEIREQVETELEALGVVLPERGAKVERFANLDEETKAKAEAIFEKVKEGTLSREEAKTELETLV